MSENKMTWETCGFRWIKVANPLNEDDHHWIAFNKSGDMLWAGERTHQLLEDLDREAFDHMILKDAIRHVVRCYDESLIESHEVVGKLRKMVPDHGDPADVEPGEGPLDPAEHDQTERHMLLSTRAWVEAAIGRWRKGEVATLHILYKKLADLLGIPFEK